MTSGRDIPSDFRVGDSSLSPVRDQRQPVDDGIKPALSKHFDNVHKLYMEELEILKKSLKHCQYQDKNLIPEFDHKEDEMFSNFPPSPETERPQQESSKIE